jgi:hypothetical protein
MFKHLLNQIINFDIPNIRNQVSGLDEIVDVLLKPYVETFDGEIFVKKDHSIDLSTQTVSYSVLFYGDGRTVVIFSKVWGFQDIAGAQDDIRAAFPPADKGLLLKALAAKGSILSLSTEAHFGQL